MSPHLSDENALSKPIKLANLKPGLVHFFRLHISSIRPNLNCRGSHRAAIIDILARDRRPKRSRKLAGQALQDERVGISFGATYGGTT